MLTALDGQADAMLVQNGQDGIPQGEGGFHVEMSQEAKYQDSAYGVTRPVAYVVPDDDESAAEEAENKILSKAVM